MALELNTQDSVPKGIRKIVCKRIDKALAMLNGKSRAVTDKAVHDVRKRFKEIRGTLRLVRDELGEKIFRKENRTYRDAARPLSEMRDSKVMVDTLDNLLGHFQGRVKAREFAPLRRKLLQRRREIRKKVLSEDRAVPGILKEIRQAKKRVKNWPLEHCGWNAVGTGLERVYAQGRKSMSAVRQNPTDETFHEWRKRTKDLRYELELLAPVWRETVAPMAEQAKHLTELLGDDHDLAVLRTLALELNQDSPLDNELLLALINERRSALQREASELGDKIYAEGEKGFIKRLKGYWKAERDKQQVEA
jgi:CHAD domain-containing protein